MVLQWDRFDLPIVGDPFAADEHLAMVGFTRIDKYITLPTGVVWSGDFQAVPAFPDG